MFKHLKELKDLNLYLETLTGISDDPELKVLKNNVKVAMKNLIVTMFMLALLLISVLLGIINEIFFKSPVGSISQHILSLVAATYFFQKSKSSNDKISFLIYGFLIGFNLIGLGLTISELIY